MTLAAAWKIGTDKSARNSPPQIFNCVTGSKNPILFGDLFNSFAQNGRKFPHSELTTKILFDNKI
jgi:hypothetical protein